MNNKIELQEIKKNQTGSGLLIERDGYISMSDLGNKNIMEDVKSEGWRVPNPFIVDAVFQKFDIENANNRIYPKDVLKPQVEIYIKKYLEQNCSTGEADHPECICDKDAMVLTRNGWKSLWDNDIIDTEVLTYNDSAKRHEFKKVNDHYVEYYKGDVIHIKGDGIDVTVTPNHKFPIYIGQKSFVGQYTASDILNGAIPDKDRCYISNTIGWMANSQEFFTLNAPDIFPKFFSKKSIKAYSEPVTIQVGTWVKVVALFLSCGHVNTSRNLSKTYLSICNSDLLKKTENILKSLPFKYNVASKRIKSKEIIIDDIRLSDYLRSINNKVPYFVKNLPKDDLCIFYEWFSLGLGKNGKISAKDKPLSSDILEILAKIGYSPSIELTDKAITIDKYGMENIFLDSNIMINVEPYYGKVACIGVNNHNFFVNVKGKCFWSGNSSSISTKTISHMVTELHWEGNTLVGKMKIITSEGFRKFGIISCMGDMIANLLLSGVKIGVSSRGIGSVENRMGKYYVGDDFELVCWDIVTQPSTPGSWIGLNKQDIQQYVESIKNDNSVMIEKMKKLDKYIL